jgi:uridine kinase
MQNKRQTQQQLLAHIKAGAAHKSPYIVAVDGYAGAGKSTLAQWLAAQLQVAQVVTLDDFYRALTPEQENNLHADAALRAYFDMAEFANNVLLPLQNNTIATWQPVDWLTGRSLATKQLVPESVVIIEGVFACAHELLEHVDMSVMVTAEQALCQQRVLARPQEDAAWYQHWAATEEWYHRSNQTQARVNYLYTGDG